MTPKRAQCGGLALSGAAAAIATVCLAACSAPAPAPETPVSSVVVVPFEVVGPVEQPGFVGRAVAESLARRLEPVPDLRVLEPAAAIESGVATLAGEYRRGEDQSCLELRARVAGRADPLWSVVRCSGYASIPDLVDDLTRGCLEALGREPPERYPYIGHVEGGAEMAGSPQLAAARERFRKGDFVGFAEAARRLVDRFPSDPDSHVVRAWSLMLTWDLSPSAEGLSALRDELDVLKRGDPHSPYDDVMRAFVYRRRGRGSCGSARSPTRRSGRTRRPGSTPRRRCGSIPRTPWRSWR
jgi:hypothetical protein